MFADGEHEIRLTQNGSRMHCGDGITDVVDIGPNTHHGNRNSERLADFKRGITVRISEEAEDQVRLKFADKREQNAGGHIQPFSGRESRGNAGMSW